MRKSKKKYKGGRDETGGKNVGKQKDAEREKENGSYVEGGDVQRLRKTHKRVLQ